MRALAGFFIKVPALSDNKNLTHVAFNIKIITGRHEFGIERVTETKRHYLHFTSCRRIGVQWRSVKPHRKTDLSFAPGCRRRGGSRYSRSCYSGRCQDPSRLSRDSGRQPRGLEKEPERGAVSALAPRRGSHRSTNAGVGPEGWAAEARTRKNGATWDVSPRNRAARIPSPAAGNDTERHDSSGGRSDYGSEGWGFEFLRACHQGPVRKRLCRVTTGGPYDFGSHSGSHPLHCDPNRGTARGPKPASMAVRPAQGASITNTR